MLTDFQVRKSTIIDDTVASRSCISSLFGDPVFRSIISIIVNLKPSTWIRYQIKLLPHSSSATFLLLGVHSLTMSEHYSGCIYDRGCSGCARSTSSVPFEGRSSLRACRACSLNRNSNYLLPWGKNHGSSSHPCGTIAHKGVLSFQIRKSKRINGIIP